MTTTKVLKDGMVATRIERAEDITCGDFVIFIDGYDLAKNRPTSKRGFIRSFMGDRARITAGGGTYLVKIDPEFIRWSLSTQ